MLRVLNLAVELPYAGLPTHQTTLDGAMFAGTCFHRGIVDGNHFIDTCLYTPPPASTPEALATRNSEIATSGDTMT